MKTIKLLLITICLISFSNLNAQEKQNDATWKETVNFIEKYFFHLKSVKKYYFRDRNWEHTTGSIVDKGSYKENGKSLSVTNILVWDGKTSSDTKIRVNVLLNKLKSADVSGSYLTLRTVGDDCWHDVLVNDFPKQKSKRIKFYVPDSEMRPRLEKAFKQMAYLATQRRIKERKTSGDKF